MIATMTPDAKCLLEDSVPQLRTTVLQSWALLWGGEGIPERLIFNAKYVWVVEYVYVNV